MNCCFARCATKMTTAVEWSPPLFARLKIIKKNGWLALTEHESDTIMAKRVFLIFYSSRIHWPFLPAEQWHWRNVCLQHSDGQVILLVMIIKRQYDNDRKFMSYLHYPDIQSCIAIMKPKINIPIVCNAIRYWYLTCHASRKIILEPVFQTRDTLQLDILWMWIETLAFIFVMRIRNPSHLTSIADFDHWPRRLLIAGCFNAGKELLPRAPSAPTKGWLGRVSPFTHPSPCLPSFWPF